MMLRCPRDLTNEKDTDDAEDEDGRKHVGRQQLK